MIGSTIAAGFPRCSRFEEPVLRFVALRWTPVDRDGERHARALLGKLARRGAWRTLIDWRGLVLLASECARDVAPIELLGGHGAAFGALFTREGGAVQNIPPVEAARLAEDGGDLLVERFWGGYVAVLVDRGRDLIHVVRDPTGAQQCFHAVLGPVNAVFSDAQDFAAMAGGLEPDLVYIGGFLAHAGLRLGRTGLAGVRELDAGERMTLGRTEVQRHRVWRPQSVPLKQDASFAALAGELREAAGLCIGAWGRTAPKVMHRLSGGLDSAVVLAMLAQYAPDTEIMCVNEHAEESPEGDERAYARITAQRWNARLIETRMRPEAVCYDRALAAPLDTKPTLALLSFADRTIVDQAEELKADFITSGQGGDHLFQRRRTPLIAADAVREGRPLHEALKVAMDVARLCGVSFWEVAAAMLVSGVARRPLDWRHLMKRVAPLASADAGEAALAEWAEHDWLVGARKLSPARALRVWHFQDAIRYHAPSVLNVAVPTTPVLISQPLVELCLATPSYVMVEGGRERALARAAFADDLPPTVHARSTKGETTRYFAAVLQHNFEIMRELLLGGELVDTGLLDRARLESALRRGLITSGVVADGLMSALAAEIWLRNLKRVSAEARETQQPDQAVAN